MTLDWVPCSYGWSKTLQVDDEFLSVVPIVLVFTGGNRHFDPWPFPWATPCSVVYNA